MEGAVIEKLELRRSDLRFPFPEGFAQGVTGRRITGLGRRAKYLLIDLDDGMTIIGHLGMSGSFRIEEGNDADIPGTFHHARTKDEKHDHVVFHLSDAKGHRRIVYNDPRRFGFMDFTSREALPVNPFLFALGPEPTGNLLSAEWLAERWKDKVQPLKSALLDQRNIAGLGNIYVCEALWRAHLSPLRKAGSLVTPKGRPKDQLQRLVEAIRAVIAEAIEAGGSSLRDHIQTDGSMGYFQHSFSVYDQEGKPCRTPGCAGTIERVTQSGRSTFYCASCQK